MKRLTTMLVLCIFVFQTPLIAELNVLTNEKGQTVVEDTVTHYLWHPRPGNFAIADEPIPEDPNPFEQQKAMIQAMSAGGDVDSAYYGRTDWHMATEAEMASLFADTTSSETTPNSAFVGVFERTFTKSNGSGEIYARYNKENGADMHYATRTLLGSSSTLDTWPGRSSRPFSLSYLDTHVAYFLGAWAVSTQGPSIPSNNPPVAIARNVEKEADPISGTAVVTAAEVDNGSSDPEGDVITLSLDPAGPFGKGDTIVILTVTDDAGLTDTATATITVLDVTPPVITLIGAASMTLECGVDTYTELGATASDNCDAIVAVDIGGDTVDASACGIYIVTYDAVDASGNAAIQVTRTVTVEDTIPALPEITIDLLTDTLWPPNKRLVKVADISATDLDGLDAGLLVEVTSNESITQCDWVWDGDTGELYLRAARDGRGDGRVYTIAVTAMDGSGNMAKEVAVVTVPHDQGKIGKKDKGNQKGGKKDKDKGRNNKNRKGNDHDNRKDKDKHKGYGDDRAGNRGGKRR